MSTSLFTSISNAVLVDQSSTTPLQLPQEFPFALMIASGMWYIQQKTKSQLMKRQEQFMGKERYMKHFTVKQHHEFVTALKTGSADHGFHNDKGLPEDGNGLGIYSQRLSYNEWHRLSCARLAYNELAEKTPIRTF